MPQTLLTRWLLRFHRDRRGGIAVMSAVAAVPLCAMSLAAYEYHQVVTVRTLLQDGIDAATLAAGRSGKKLDADLKAVGMPVLRAHLSRTAATLTLQDSDVTFSNVNGRITGVASICVKPLIGYVVGLPPTCPAARSEVQREGTVLEVALVLDNSGSMGNTLSSGVTRLQAMQAAATGFIDKLAALDDPSVADDIRIGIVPFAGSVRINSADPDSGWLDVDGKSSVNSHAYGIADPLFHSVTATLAGAPSGVAQPKRLAMFQALGVTWAGCVESRPGTWGTSDAPPDPLNPDSQFVPYFAPDEIDQRLELTSLMTPVQASPEPNNYLDDGIDAVRVDPDGPAGPLPPRPMTNDEKAWVYLSYWRQLPYLVEKYAPTNPLRTSLTHRVTEGNPPVTFLRTINVTNEIAANNMGPNRWCQTRPVTPLSNQFPTLKTSLTNMPLARHTNIPHALMWGWHVLSPNAPFSDGKPYGTRNVRKILVLMTDGENLMDPPGGSGGENQTNLNNSYYGPYGYLWRGRLGLPLISTEAQVTGALNTRMTTICDNMKAPGKDVTVFTIQFAQGGVNDPSMVHCASPGGFRNAAQANQLDAAFQSIAEAISDLRVSR